jgi:hypothetical protein
MHARSSFARFESNEVGVCSVLVGFAGKGGVRVNGSYPVRHVHTPVVDAPCPQHARVLLPQEGKRRRPNQRPDARPEPSVLGTTQEDGALLIRWEQHQEGCPRLCVPMRALVGLRAIELGAIHLPVE